MINVGVACQESGRSVRVLDGVECPSLCVATRPQKSFDNYVSFFTNEEYGNSFNIDASSSGTPENIHDGEDNTYWSGTNVNGTNVDFNDTTRPYTGTKSIRVNKPTLNNVWQFDKGSSFNFGNYVSITFYINVNSGWNVGGSVELYGYNTGTGLQVGDAVAIENYFDAQDFDVWQMVTIPLSDMSLTTSTDALRMKMATVLGTTPDFYIDDMQIQQSGNPIEYTFQPKVGQWVYVNDFTTSVARTYTPPLPIYFAYDDLLGLSLTSGLVYKRIVENEVVSTHTLRTLMDFVELPGTSIIDKGFSAGDAWLVLRAVHIEPILLKWENGDKMIFTISEDLSSFLTFKQAVGAKIEWRPKNGFITG